MVANEEDQAHGSSEWHFLSNHAVVLLCVVADAEIRMRDVANKVGITERAVQRIISDLVDTGYLTRIRTGRRNSYEVHLDLPLRHPLKSNFTVGQLFTLVMDDGSSSRPRAAAPVAARATAPRKPTGKKA